MQPVLLIESRAGGVLTVNGVFCGPIEEGQTFPAGRNAEIYVQLFPFGEAMPLTVMMQLRDGRIEKLSPRENAYALIWPDGVIELELRCAAAQAMEREEAWRTQEDAQEGHASGGLLERYLNMRLMGDPRAQGLLLDVGSAMELSAYEAVVPLRFVPQGADGRYDEKAGLVRRLEENVAAVDAAMAVSMQTRQGGRRLGRMEIMRT